MASDLFPAKAALISTNYRRHEDTDHNIENRNIFNSLSRERGGDSRDRYDSERAKRNSRYEMSDRVDKWTKNSNFSVRVDRGRPFPHTSNDNNERRRDYGNAQRGNRNQRSRTGRSRSRSFSPDRRNDFIDREERSFGARLGGKRDDDRWSGRSWDRRDRS